MNRKIISLDFAIKTILKAGDKKVIEGLINAILEYTSGNNNHITVVEFLDKEFNKDNKLLKTSIADLLIKDQNNNYYVFEIERTDDRSIFHKALSNTSKIIHNCVLKNTGGKDDYLVIKKVFHLTLAFFDVGENAVVVRGNTKFTNLTENKPFKFNIKNDKGEKISATDIFPEYITLCVNNFNDKVKANLDEWLYAFKHEEIKDDFNAPGIKEAADTLDYINMTPAQKAELHEYRKSITDAYNQAQTAMAKGEEKKAKSMIINMLNKKMPHSDIGEIANVDISVVEKISAELS